jgi:hypothetical protein
MITGRRSSLELRCKERGYTLDDIRACIVSEDGDMITVDEHHSAYPRPKAPRPQSLVSPPAHQRGGPGTELKGLLKLIGITSSPNCSCNARAKQMDEWGADECERRMPEILEWLEQEANRRGLPFVRFAAEQAVKLAIRRARKNAVR